MWQNVHRYRNQHKSLRTWIALMRKHRPIFAACLADVDGSAGAWLLRPMSALPPKADIAEVGCTVAIGSGAKIGGQLCPTSTRLSLAPDSPGRPWRGDWWLQAGRLRSSNANCSAVHASTPAAPRQRL